MALGSNLLAGFKINTGTWGTGAGFGAVVCGAGDGFEVEGEGLKVDPNLIQNNGLSGYGVRKVGTHGTKMVSGDFGPAPAYYRGLEVPLTCAFGSQVAPAALGGTAAYGHALHLASTCAGIHGTAALYGSDHPAVRELPFAKVGGFTLDATPNNLVKLTFPMVGFDMLVNEGALDADGIMTAVEPADGAQAVVGYPAFPFFLTVLMTDADNSVTEFVLTFTGADENGDYQTEVYTLSTDGKEWTGSKRWTTITAITASGKAGTSTSDTIQVGYIPGINTLATGASISLPASADVSLLRFDQLKVWMNAQNGPDFTDSLPSADPAGDLLPVESLRITLNRALKTDKVTTRFGDRIDEPQDNDFKSATVAVKFPEWDTYNNAWLHQRLLAGALKMKVSFLGPAIATGYQAEMSFFFNNLQISSHTVNVGGPGEVPIEFEMEAHRATANPTGLPAWADAQPISGYLVNLRTTTALA